jgi:hypothetical protein
VELLRHLDCKKCCETNASQEYDNNDQSQQNYISYHPHLMHARLNVTFAYACAPAFQNLWIIVAVVRINDNLHWRSGVAVGTIC